MALIFMDGFVAGDLTLWDFHNANIVASPAGFDTDYCADINLNPGTLMKCLATAKTEIYICFLWKVVSVTEPSYSAPIVTFMKGNTPLASLYRTSSNPHVLTAARGHIGTALASSTTAPVLNTVYRLEIHYKSDDANGIFQVKLNGNLEIDFSGDTCDSETSFDHIYFGNIPSVGALYASKSYIGNVFFDDAAWVGDLKITKLIPNAAGNSSQYSGSYADIDEIPASDADGLETNSADQLSLFGLSDPSGNIEAVKAVMVQARVVSQGPVTPKNIKPAVRIGGADNLGDAQAVPCYAPHAVAKIWELNPNTGVAWTVDNLNSLEAGVKSAA